MKNKNKNIIPDILEVLKAQRMDLKEEERREYLREKAKQLSQIVRNFLGIEKGGVAYTYFVPKSATFESGIWGDYSPTIFWGLANEEEKKNVILSSFLYYIFWKDIPPYTIFWIEQISSIIPYNILLMERKNIKNDFEAEVDEKELLIRIFFSSSIYYEIDTFHKNCLESLQNYIQLSKIEKREELEKWEEEGLFGYNFRDVIDLKEFFLVDENGLFGYNFRDVMLILEKLEKNNPIPSIENEQEINKIATTLSDVLKKVNVFDNNQITKVFKEEF